MFGIEAERGVWDSRSSGKATRLNEAIDFISNQKKLAFREPTCELGLRMDVRVATHADCYEIIFVVAPTGEGFFYMVDLEAEWIMPAADAAASTTSRENSVCGALWDGQS